MAVGVAQPISNRNVVAFAAADTTGASAAFAIPPADAYTFYLNITTAGQTSCDVVFQTSVDGGTTYVNIPWRFAQVTTATGTFCLNVHAGVGPGTETGTTTTGQGTNIAASGGALSLQALVDPRFMKVLKTISGTGPVGSLYCLAWPRGERPTGVD